ncbi:hypothetical protein ACMFMG_005383 [Clarireedia jacksonii]
MSTATSITNPSKLFTHTWILTLPTHPDLQFIHVTPSNTSSVIQIFSNPLNAAWAPTDTESYMSKFLKSFRAAKTKRNYLQLLIMSLSEQQILGMGALVELQDEPRTGNIGILLNPEGRGKGVGKAAVEVLLRLGNEFDLDIVEAGTMKGNVGMRRLMGKLGLGEREEMKWMRGAEGGEEILVAEILFGEKGKGIEIERWRGLEVGVEFGEEVE